MELLVKNMEGRKTFINVVRRSESPRELATKTRKSALWWRLAGTAMVTASTQRVRPDLVVEGSGGKESGNTKVLPAWVILLCLSR